MGRILPPLNAVRVFEASARHRSFTRAAGELLVTQAAVSQQIKALEAWLGVPLFQRGGRDLILTAAGERYLPAISGALDLLAGATAEVRRCGRPGIVTLSSPACFAAAWLIPRLAQFHAGHPAIEVSVSTSPGPREAGRTDCDIAIRFGRGSWPGLHAEPLLAQELFPVCSPELARQRPLRRLADLGRHVLLHDEAHGAWEAWARLAGAAGLAWRRGSRFGEHLLALQAAEAGRGVALGRSGMVAGALAEGRLVRPFRESLSGGFAYWLVVAPDLLAEPKVAPLREWLLEQAAA